MFSLLGAPTSATCCRITASADLRERGHWTADSEQWTADRGQRTADSGQQTVDGGQWTVDKCGRAVGHRPSPARAVVHGIPHFCRLLQRAAGGTRAAPRWQGTRCDPSGRPGRCPDLPGSCSSALAPRPPPRRQLQLRPRRLRRPSCRLTRSTASLDGRRAKTARRRANPGRQKCRQPRQAHKLCAIPESQAWRYSAGTFRLV